MLARKVTNTTFTLSLLKISVNDERFWPMEINIQKQKSKLDSFLRDGMYVQLKSGCFSYIQDPKVSGR